MTHNSPILRTHEDVRIVKVRSFSNYGTGMSLGIAIRGPEGIVLAADSRVTLPIQETLPDGSILMREFHFDNSQKLLHFADKATHGYFGAVTYGMAIIPGALRTAHSYFPEFEKELTRAGEGRLTIESYAKKLSDFYMALWKDGAPSDYKGPDMVFIVGGFDEEELYGTVFVVAIPSKPVPELRNPKETDFGMTWGGQLRIPSRIVHGYEPEMLVFLAKKFGLDEAATKALAQELAERYQYKIPFQFLPMQDCIDLAMLLIQTTEGVQSLATVPRGVGGMIEVATITRSKPLTFIQQKTLRGNPR